MSEQVRPNPSFYQLKDIMIISMMSLFYLLLSYFLIGFNSNQVWLVLIFNSLYYASAVTRKFILGFSIVSVYWSLVE